VCENVKGDGFGDCPPETARTLRVSRATIYAVARETGHHKAEVKTISKGERRKTGRYPTTQRSAGPNFERKGREGEGDGPLSGSGCKEERGPSVGVSPGSSRPRLPLVRCNKTNKGGEAKGRDGV